jgi:hypothetical protein
MDLADLQGKFTEHLTKNGCGKKEPKKNKGLCMQDTILAFVILIIGVVLGGNITGGLSRNCVRQVVVLICE